MDELEQVARHLMDSLQTRGLLNDKDARRILTEEEYQKFGGITIMASRMKNILDLRKSHE